MKKKELIYTHKFFNAIREPLEDHIDDSEYQGLDIFGPEDITASKTDHKEAVFTLADIITEELKENPELVEELDLNYSEGDTERLWTPEDGIVEEQQDNLVEDTIWSKPESEVISRVNEIGSMLKTGDTNSIAVVKSLLQNEVMIGDSDGRVYGGMIERLDTSLKKYGIKFISSGKAEIVNPDKIEVPEDDLELRIVGLEDVKDSRYAVRDYRDNVEDDYVRRVNEFDTLVSLPTLRPVDDGFEIVDGHKGTAAAEKAGVKNQLCIVEDLSDIEAATIFANDHIPPYFEGERLGSFYDEDEVREVIGLMREDFGDNLNEIDRIRPYLENNFYNDQSPEIDPLNEEMFEDAGMALVDSVAGAGVSDERREILYQEFIEGVSEVSDPEALRNERNKAVSMPDSVRASSYAGSYWKNC